MHYFNRQWDTPATADAKEKMRKAVKSHWTARYRDQLTPEERPTKRATVLDKHLGRLLFITGTGDVFDKYITGMPVSMFDCKATSLLQ